MKLYSIHTKPSVLLEYCNVMRCEHSKHRLTYPVSIQYKSYKRYRPQRLSVLKSKLSGKCYKRERFTVSIWLTGHLFYIYPKGFL